MNIWRKLHLFNSMTMALRFAALLLFMAFFGSAASAAQTAKADEVAISGNVRSDREGAMEGVILIAQREGDSFSTAVVSDANGHFAFPRDHIAPGRYHVTIRAAGYELANSAAPLYAAVKAGSPARLNVSLAPVSDPSRLASQLTTLEWVNSFPGTDAQKDTLVRNMVNCGFCHSLERIARSTHTSDEFMSVIQRMLTYESDHSSADRIQIVGTPQPIKGLHWWGRDARAIADYLATINLSNGKDHWNYALKTLPRPTGEATKAIVTVFPIPRVPSVIHDLDVDQQGNVWYGNTGWDFIGKLDPKTGKFSEWAAPNYLPKTTPPGVDRIVGVQDIQVDVKGHIWAGIGGNKLAVFAPETGKWRTFDMPVVWKNPFLSTVGRGATGIWATGLRAVPDGDKRHEQAFKLDFRTGSFSKGITLFDDKPSPKDPAHANPLNYCYMMDQDKDGNFLCTTPEASAITRADLATGQVRMIPTPTPNAYPRRGHLDDHNRFWFTEFYADKVGVIDLNTNKITEYPLPHKYVSPYYARPDRHGYVWISSTGSDRLLRLDPRTGKVVQYLMPVYYDARKVVVDVSAKKTTIWLPNKNTAQLIRVEVPE